MNKSVKPLVIFLIAFSLAINLLIGLHLSDQAHFSILTHSSTGISVNKPEAVETKCECHLNVPDDLMELVRDCVAYTKFYQPPIVETKLDASMEPVLILGFTKLQILSSYEQVMQQLHKHGNRYSLFLPGLKELIPILENLNGRDDQALAELLNFLVSSISAKAKEEGKELDGWLRGNRLDYAQRFAVSPLVEVICETGFNFGYSSLMWLYSNPTARLVEFGMLQDNYMKLGKEFVQLLFGDRFTLIEGDSTLTIPQMVLDFGGKLTCDIVHVDGGHVGDTPLRDMEGLRGLSDSDTLVLADDCGTCSYCEGPQKAWDNLKERNLLRELHCIDTIMDGGTVEGHKWCIGKYLINNVAL